MKTLFNYSNYNNDLRMTRKDAESVSHSGDCSHDVEILIQKKYIKKQISALNPDKLRKELKEYGAWDETELNDHNENIKRWLWISGNDITESN